MSLDAFVTGLLRAEGSPSYMRAVLLFEFQLALFHPKSFRELVEGMPPTGNRNHARLFAAIKLLEHIETQMQSKGEPLTLLKRLAANEDYSRIFDEVIAPGGSWRKIRHLPAAKEFDADLRAREHQAKAVACIIDFSYRFARLREAKGYKGRGGVTLARHVVRTCASYGQKQSRSTMKTRWDEYRQASAFIYLLSSPQTPFSVPKVADVNFAVKLLQQIENKEGLRKFFSAYQEVTDVLKTRGYELPALSLDLGPRLPRMVADFPRDVEAAIAASSDAYVD